MLFNNTNEKLQWNHEFLSILGLIINDTYTIEEIEKKLNNKLKKNNLNFNENFSKLINIPLNSISVFRNSLIMNYILFKFIILEDVPLYYRKDYEFKKLSNEEVNQIIQNI